MRNRKNDSDWPLTETQVNRSPHFPQGGRAQLRSLTDCPKCKFGTVDRKVNRQQQIFHLCADCGAHWTEEEWSRLPK